ncbi:MULTISPECIES: serine protease [unclassified Microcoleus]|uniref:S1 family peptidase n=1 Tax=unclassified Microcoleus TaxID=2642155 RepID=UPI0025E7B8F1|nr:MULTISPECIES: serine protease [unclassified Microcoleus]
MFSYRLRIFTISLLLTGLLFSLAKDTHEHISIKPAAISENLNREVSEIARLVTVRILSDSGSGSGVIIGRNGENYRVLTNNHVVAGNTQNYTVLTADGQTHIAKRLSSSQFSRLDLALVEFTSRESYRVVEIGNSHKLAVGDAVFGAGFPNWHWIDAKAIENTRNWGLKAFRLTAGKVGMLPEKSFVEGYQLGYTNDITEGMSGGPVLDSRGRLVGVNGRLKYPLAGIEVFTFVDGSVPSEGVFREMEALSWGIPIEIFKEWVNWRK